MDKIDEIAETTDKEIQKLKKKEELKQQLEKAKDQGARDQKTRDMSTM